MLRAKDKNKGALKHLNLLILYMAFKVVNSILVSEKVVERAAQRSRFSP